MNTSLTPGSNTPPSIPRSRKIKIGKRNPKRMPASRWFHGVGTLMGASCVCSSAAPGLRTPVRLRYCSNPRITPPEQWRAINMTSRNGNSVG
jgi:hypothetical protein